jgi:hypothetical protein
MRSATRQQTKRVRRGALKNPEGPEPQNPNVTGNGHPLVSEASPESPGTVLQETSLHTEEAATDDPTADTETPSTQTEEIHQHMQLPEVIDIDNEELKHPLKLPPDVFSLWSSVATGAGKSIWFSERKRKIDQLIESPEICRTRYAFDCDNKYILGIMLTVKIPTKPLQVYSYGTAQNNKRPSAVPTKGYDRLITFADVKVKGRCFAAVFADKIYTANFFHHGFSQGYGVGHAWLIKEPPHTKNKLGQSPLAIPLMELQSYSGIPLTNMIRYVPTSPLFIPEGIYETAYFCYHNITNLQIGKCKMVFSGCSGYLCDRQSIPDKSEKWSCGCLHTNQNKVPLVMQMNVIIPCETSMEARGKHVINDFRSFQTTSVFADTGSLANWRNESLRLEDHFRRKVCLMLKYINENGGWTILGWIRTGAIADVSDQKDKQTIASIKTEPHLTYMMPSNLQVMENVEFKTFQYNVPLQSPDLTPPPSIIVT